MNLNAWIRQTHRWVSIAFTAVVITIFITLGLGRQPAQWVYYLPLFPLAFLALSGLYLFVLPYRRGRGQRTVGD